MRLAAGVLGALVLAALLGAGPIAARLHYVPMPRADVPRADLPPFPEPPGASLEQATTSDATAPFSRRSIYTVWMTPESAGDIRQFYRTLNNPRWKENSPNLNTNALDFADADREFSVVSVNIMPRLPFTGSRFSVTFWIA